VCFSEVHMIAFIQELIRRWYDLVAKDRTANPPLEREIIPIVPEQSKTIVKDFTTYPPAAQSRKMKTQGKYRSRFPLGAVIHFTAGSNDPKAYLDDMRAKGYCAILIDRLGHVWQDFALNEWGYHAGASTWKNFGTTVNDELVGIEIMSAGKLTDKNGKLYSWFGKEIPQEECACALKNQDNMQAGWYHAFTPEQEEALEKMLVWMYEASGGLFSFDNVVGHDEVSPNRKSDPGASLSMTMPKYREYLKKKVGL